MKRYILPILLLAFLVGCTSKEIKTKDIVMYANLKNEEEAIKEYEYYHSKEGVWSEVIHAAKVSGLLKVKMYRFQNQLVMILTVPVDADMAEVDRKYAASSDKIGEWGKLMTDMFAPLQVDGEEKIWVEMKTVHHYEDGQVY